MNTCLDPLVNTCRDKFYITVSDTKIQSTYKLFMMKLLFKESL